MSYLEWASVEAEMDAPLLEIAKAAGSDGHEGTVIYSDGILYVDVVDQAALDAALAGFDPAAHARGRLIAYAADKRWQIETGGIVVAGATVATDRDSQGMIGRAYSLALAEPDEPVDYKAESGWVSIDSATLVAIAVAVGRHVRACFRTEKLVCDQIAAGTITSVAEVDAAFAEAFT